MVVIYGQWAVLCKFLLHPINGNSNPEVLSLEEILAEGAFHLNSDRRPAVIFLESRYTKMDNKFL
jgi:hypothetical protein